MSRRSDSDEAWVLDLCDAILGEQSRRQHSFDWLRGDRSLKTGRRRRLPVDAYYPKSRIVVEYCERQHFEPVAHFDKPGQLAATGMPRREQRSRYDALRERVIPEHGLQLLVVTPKDLDSKPNGRLRRHATEDLSALVAMLSPLLRVHEPRRKLREEFVRREVEARLILNRSIGVVAALHDNGTGHSMVDATFTHADGRRAVVEVTRVMDGVLAAQRKEVSQSDVIPALSDAWYVRISRRTSLKQIRSVLPGVLARLESDGIEKLNLEARLIGHASDGVVALRDAGVRLIARWDGADPGTVMYAQSALIGVGASPGELGDFLTDVVNGKTRADNVSKLRKHADAGERHLFIWLEFDQAIRWMSAFDSGIPADAPGPDVPDCITHVWLAASMDRVVMWSREMGWSQRKMEAANFWETKCQL